MGINWPRRNLPDGAGDWARRLEEEVDGLVRRSSQSEQADVNNDRVTDSTNKTLGQQISDIASTVKTLKDLSIVSYAEFNNPTGVGGFTGFYPNGLATVSGIVTSTGRIEIEYGGALNGGQGYFVYSVARTDDGVILVDRNTIIQNAAQRVAVTGGASFAPSGFRRALINVTAGIPLTIKVEASTDSTYTNFFGASILVRPAI